MPFSYYNRLTARQQLIYRKSDAIESVNLPHAAPLVSATVQIARALSAADRLATQAACQALVDALTSRLGVPAVCVWVLAKRPELRDGELHGLYEPAERGTPVRISVWMRTARRKQVVAFRTFLRTLLHEFCHHLDYECYKLHDSFHTEGFYKRESSLLKQLLPLDRLVSGDP
ncbi:MAG: hypothetical protein OEP48_07675 [Betaproteobacteria bacterium]|nr:hypothetical protein [Betaproteobacteria bacterium]MDH3438196.1 hypothetical protein [Betaproteobacteria bacterium]